MESQTKSLQIRTDEPGFGPVYCKKCGEILFITDDEKGEYYLCPQHGRIEWHDLKNQLHPEDYN